MSCDYELCAFTEYSTMRILMFWWGKKKTSYQDEPLMEDEKEKEDQVKKLM